MTAQGRACLDCAVTVVTAGVGILGLAAGAQNWLRQQTQLHERIMLVVGGLLFTYPAVSTDLAGFVIMSIAGACTGCAHDEIA